MALIAGINVKPAKISLSKSIYMNFKSHIFKRLNFLQLQALFIHLIIASKPFFPPCMMYEMLAEYFAAG